MNFGRLTTLNIEGHSASVLSVKTGRVEKWGTTPLQPDSIKDSIIVDPESVGATLDQLFQSVNIPKSNVFAGITGFRSVFRLITLPKMNTGLTRDAIHWTARRELQLDLDETYLSWQTVSHKGEEQRIFLLGTPKVIVDTVYRSLIAASIVPRNVELKPLALSRTVNESEAIIIDIEPESMSFIILAGGIPAVIRTIEVKPEELFLEDRARMITDNLSRTIEYFKQVHNEFSVDSGPGVFITGSFADMPDAVALFQKSTGYSIVKTESGIQHAKDFPASRYAANIGLALKKLGPVISRKERSNPIRPININLKGPAPEYSI